MAKTIEYESAKTDRKADIVFCMDATASMAPCFEGVRNNLIGFIDGLSSHGHVDWRFKLLAYRDKHNDPTSTWQDFSFTNSGSVFKSYLNQVKPLGGRTYKDMDDDRESSLDALYMAVKSDWRKDSQLQKVVVLLTDSDSHPILHTSTYNLPDNTIEAVLQGFQTLKHSMLYMIAPDVPVYNELDRRLQLANKKVYFDPQEVNGTNKSVAKYLGLSNIDFKMMLTIIAESISSSF
jgi:hypothetical protein